MEGGDFNMWIQTYLYIFALAYMFISQPGAWATKKLPCQNPRQHTRNSNPAPDWLAAQPPTNQKPPQKNLAIQHGCQHEPHSATQIPVV